MKIEAAVRNARALLAIQEEFGSFDAYCWRFVKGRPKVNRWKMMRGIQLRWFDRRLCAHAGRRHGERSHR
jgi:DNA-3-methyladenine glycosylase I